MRRRVLTYWLPRIALTALAVVYFGGIAAAREFWEFHREYNIKRLVVYRTDKYGRKFRSPAYDQTYYKCSTIRLPYGEIVRDYMPYSVSNKRRCAADCGFLGGDPGQLEHILAQEAMETLDRTEIRFPFPEPEEEGTIYAAIDLMAWVEGEGDEEFDISVPETVSVVDGTSSSLPGYVIGTSELIFDPESGWEDPDPYTGDVQLVAEMLVVQEEDEPVGRKTQWGYALVALLGIGAGTVLIRRSQAPRR